MGLAQRTEDVDTHAYWADVNEALTEVCGLSRQDAANAVTKSRQALTCLSDWGRLLVYHDSVPQAVEDLWKRGSGAAALEEETQAMRRALIEWYAERNRKRGLSHGAVGSSALG